LWRFDYRHGIKPGTDKPRRLTLAQGIDPGVERKARQAARLKSAANTFSIVAREWYEEWCSGVSPSMQSGIRR
jgi:hypothetical protein